MSDAAAAPPPSDRGLVARADASGVPQLLARLVVGGMFLWLGVQKMLEPIPFLKVLKQYEMLPLDPPHIINTTAVVLPWIEIGIGLCLVTGLARRGAAALSIGLLAVFTLAVYLRALGIQEEGNLRLCQVVLDCGCGAGPIPICTKILENSGLFLLSFVPLLSRSHRFRVGRPRI